MDDFINKYNWNEIQKTYDTGKTVKHIKKLYNINNIILKLAINYNLFKIRTTSESMKLSYKLGRKKTVWTDEMKKHQSESKTNYYNIHPEKHPNRKICGNYKKLTYPEKIAYSFFKENNINFISHTAIKYENIHYFPDFILDEKLIIEIDGEKWHSSKEQKEYDNIRDERLKSLGFKIIRIPAKNVLQNLKILFPKSKIDMINLEELKTKIIIIEKPKKYCKTCNTEIKYSKSGYCTKHCVTYKRNENIILFKNGIQIKVEELKNLVIINTLTDIAKMFNVTDNCIKKKCKVYNINIPSHKGDWKKTEINNKIINLFKENVNIEEISKIVNLPIDKIQKIIKKKLKIKKFIPNLNIDKQTVINMYCDGCVERDIAKKCNCGKTSVRNIIQNWINHYPI